ncbi:MAG: hypothetical protein QHJ34_12880 [bacterium]|jgi:hypothetical protein|nr:hypothetical protein [candidate division KSB1 bacterium]MDH7561107.1 hypothetical protein [bacterium]
MCSAEPRQPQQGASRKPCSKVILEDTWLTFKTEIAFPLNEHPRIVGPRRYRYHSPLISAEWCAFSNYPWGRGLINFAPAEEALATETYRTWARLFELLRFYSCIVDRFHISAQVYQWRVLGRQLDVGWLEERLLPLGFRLVLCTRAPDSFGAAREKRLAVSGNPAQYDDLGLFAAEQALFREFTRRSHLPSMEVEVSHDGVNRAVEQIAHWFETTGGLYI